MSTNSYDRGDMIELAVTFTDLEGAPTDPTAVTCSVLHSGVVTVYAYGVDAALTKSGTGVYALALTLDDVGTWQYRWDGTGNLAAAEEGRFFVRRTQF